MEEIFWGWGLFAKLLGLNRTHFCKSREKLSFIGIYIWGYYQNLIYFPRILNTFLREFSFTLNTKIITCLQFQIYTHSSTGNFSPPIPVFDWVIFCCGNLIIHQRKKKWKWEKHKFYDEKQKSIKKVNIWAFFILNLPQLTTDVVYYKLRNYNWSEIVSGTHLAQYCPWVTFILNFSLEIWKNVLMLLPQVLSTSLLSPGS